MEITEGEGVMHVIDGVSGEYSASLYPCISYGGHIAYITGTLSHLPEWGKSLTIHQIALGSAYSFGTITAKRDIRNMGESLVQLVNDGVIKPRISTHSVIGIDKANDALLLLRKGHVSGKLVVTVVPSQSNHPLASSLSSSS
jgi:NADPH2:quinone reductase